MHASLVFDDKQLYLPESMGRPKENQLTGTIHENLGELASRICYDSLGSGRSSEALHQHILDVQNHSIYEHIVFTFGFDLTSCGLDPFQFARAFANRKGIWFEDEPNRGGFEITINLRAILEWERHTRGFNTNALTAAFGEVLQRWAHAFVPRIIPEAALTNRARGIAEHSWYKQNDLTNDQANITLYLYGSRGFTHEQVRHRNAISQRSTRYVDEDGSPYITHPLVKRFLADRSVDWNVEISKDDAGNPVMIPEQQNIAGMIEESVGADRKTYRNLVRVLQRYGMERMGITDKTAARKQARGAARGYLGNALASDMLYTTSITGWKWILSQRKNKLADAEIREVYTPALTALQVSSYGDRFSEFTLVPSPDGLGTVLG
jgi:thymidylate synthase ThyX